MRDTYVEIPNYENNKINASFFYGGASLAVQSVQRNYGIKIDRYAVVDFKSFRNIIDTLGGIDIELREEEIDYINWQCWVNGQVDTRDEMDINQFIFYDNGEGEMVANVHLNGRQALWHARNRGEEGICSGDDFARTQRQREVIDAVIEKVQASSIADLIKIAYDVAPMITTNMNLPDTIKTSLGMPNYLKYKTVGHKVPQQFNFDYDTVNGASVLRISNFEEEKNALYEFIFNKDAD